MSTKTNATLEPLDPNRLYTIENLSLMWDRSTDWVKEKLYYPERHKPREQRLRKSPCPRLTLGDKVFYSGRELIQWLQGPGSCDGDPEGMDVSE